MFDENAFSLDSFDQDSWLFLLEVPYFDLTGKQRIFVRSVLESVYSVSEVNQIVSVATQNNLSVLDASTAIRVSAVLQQTIVSSQRRVKVEKQPREMKPSRQQKIERNNLPSYVVDMQERICVLSTNDQGFAVTNEQSIFTHTSNVTVFTVGTSDDL